MQQEATPLTMKVVVVGDGTVGKTCVLISYAHKTFPKEYVPTVFENHLATVKLDNRVVYMGLWDTAGQEEYARLRPLAYNNCDLFLIVFSVVDPVTFENAQTKWFNELQEVTGNVPKFFIGNKIDLRDDKRDLYRGTKNAPIERQQARQIIESKFQSRYFECSALTHQGIDEVFNEAVRSTFRSKLQPIVRKRKESTCTLI